MWPLNTSEGAGNSVNMRSNRRVLRWTCIFSCILFGWLVYQSRSRIVGWMSIDGKYQATFFVGRFSIAWLNEGVTFADLPYHLNQPTTRGFWVESYDAHPLEWWFCFSRLRWHTALGIPFWVPFIFVIALSAFVFWRTRAYPAGCCQRCGYCLHYLESQICPECGKTLSS